MKTETKLYNPFDHLLTQADMGDYLTQAFLDDDPAVFVTALGHVAKAKGIAQLATDTGLNRESLYKALSGEGNPSFATILKVTSALGIRLHAQTAPSA